MVATHGGSLVRSIWQGPCNGFGDFQGRPKEATALIDVSTLDPQDPLWGVRGGKLLKRVRGQR